MLIALTFSHRNAAAINLKDCADHLFGLSAPRDGSNDRIALKERSDEFVLELHEVLTQIGIRHDILKGEHGVLEIRISPEQNHSSRLGNLARALQTRLHTEIRINPYHLGLRNAGAEFSYSSSPHRIYLSLHAISRVNAGYMPSHHDLHEIHHAHITHLWETTDDGLFIEGIFPRDHQKFRGLDIYNGGFHADELSAFAHSFIARSTFLRRLETRLRSGETMSEYDWMQLRRDASYLVRNFDVDLADATSARMNKRMLSAMNFWIPRLTRASATRVERQRTNKVVHYFLNANTEILMQESKNNRGLKYISLELHNERYELHLILRGRRWNKLLKNALQSERTGAAHELLEALRPVILERFNEVGALAELNRENYEAVITQAALVLTLDEAELEQGLNRLRSLLVRTFDTSKDMVRPRSL